MASVSVRIDSGLDQWVKALAAATGRTKTHILNEAIARSREDLEDIYHAIEALENPGSTCTLEEMRKKLGLDN